MNETPYNKLQRMAAASRATLRHHSPVQQSVEPFGDHAQSLVTLARAEGLTLTFVLKKQ